MEIINYSEKRFLVVEDQRPFLVMLRGLLNTMGAQSVAVAQNAETAISLCRKEKFDFVVCDIHLGADKKNGFELIEELRLRKLLKPTTVVLVISADSARHLVIGSIEKEPDDYLIKPFSQIQLKTRLNRAYHRRTELANVYKAMAKDDNEAAIDACLDLLKGSLNYRQTCLKLLAELYLRNGDYEAAKSLAERANNQRPIKWAQKTMAQSHLGLKQPEEAISMAESLLKANRFNVDAYDVLASAHTMQKKHDSALEDIQQAVSIAPLSLQRQFHAASIARNAGDFEFAKDSCQAIWQISKRSVHRDVVHLSNYIRSILDVAEHADDKKTRNRFQQEALITLQRNRNDEVFTRGDDSFDFNLYEAIVHSRINALDGKTIQAKKLLEEAQIGIEAKYEEYPLKLAPDSFKVMEEIGDYEDAERLGKLLVSRIDELDPNVRYLIENENKQHAEQHEAYKAHNKAGIEAYRDGKYETAMQSFTAAKALAPVNIGVALNLLQSIVKLLGMQRKPEPKLVIELRQVYKLVNGLPLRDNHQQKLDDLQEELAPYLDLNK
ncbi:response regulator [Alteromonas sp. ASW11-36]|uniref:Response regulator n=1 Tax=Alteromonas arenosi TaxID=3055817 RepID=A0ABT7SXU1_9ALTE|nr:tetratricopeptide repeat-containing response regulator [Alteromonas sp. ASW11-36]MDM7861005.1 response regulator [Alteromonas sp. ASW11-36]